MGATKNNFGKRVGGGRLLSTPASILSADGHAGRLHPDPRASNFSEWQHEREQLLQRICERVDVAVKLGKPVRTAARQFARRWNGRALKSDPSRRLRLAQFTLLAKFYHWRKNGHVPSAFRLRYHRPSAPVIPVLVLNRFAAFCSTHSFPNLKTAVRAFNTARGNLGRGSRRKGDKPITVETLRRYFPASKFQARQECLREISNAERELGRLNLELAAQYKDRWPDRPARARKKPDFQI